MVILNRSWPLTSITATQMVPLDQCKSLLITHSPISHQPICPRVLKVMFQQCMVLSPTPLHTQKGSQFTQQNSIPHKPLMPDLCSCDAAAPASPSCPYTPLRGLEMFYSLTGSHANALKAKSYSLLAVIPLQDSAQCSAPQSSFPDHPIKALLISVLTTSASAVNTT